MRSEVDAAVLAYLDQKVAQGGATTATDLLTTLGVPNPTEERSEWAWSRQGDPSVICTIWCETIDVSGGTWTASDRLNWHQELGGGARDAMWRRRAERRLELLKRAFTRNEPVIAVLQINRKSREDLDNGDAANVELRVRDEINWRIREFDPQTLTFSLVRGDGFPIAADRTENSEYQALFGFPDPETRQKIERAAVQLATAH
jgi:hypothetical protein